MSFPVRTVGHDEHLRQVGRGGTATAHRVRNADVVDSELEPP
jgi:hypothetical protein